MKYKISEFLRDNYPISQMYGARPDYYKQFDLKGHEGVDYATPTGTEIISPFDGVILRDVDDPKSGNYGIYIVVWDPVQLCAMWFCHLQDNLVKNGDKVSKGQTLGHTDNTGNTSGPHLHVNFVETDATGNRLNKDNGFQGFLNLLDYVEFENGTNPTIPIPDLSIYVPGALINLDKLGIKEAQAIVGDYIAKDSLIKQLSDDKDNLNLQLTECQNRPADQIIKFVTKNEASNVPNWIRRFFGDTV